jgi:hypothetical protein
MIKTLNLLIPAAVLIATIALALYAMPRAYQDLTPGKLSEEIVVPTTDLQGAGRIHGRVTWKGDIPQVPLISGMISVPGAGPRWDSVSNPAAPKIDSESKGIANVVVYLKGVGMSKKWPYPPVSIKMIGEHLVLNQGDAEKPIGFIPLGGEIEIVSRDPAYQMLRARGAAFFTLPLPRPNQPEKRKFDHVGHVAFTSATGYIWSEADAFVCENPYYTLTSEHGSFEITNVPPGRYEIVAWLKNWNVLRRDRDPETGKIMRLNFDKPLIIKSQLNLAEGQSANVELKLP